MENITNNPYIQDAKNVMGKGPVAESVKTQHAKVAREFGDLAGSRHIPEGTAVTGQPLTHYHSFFYRLLSWQNPRATAIAFTVNVLIILAARYLPLLRWLYKTFYVLFGVTATAELIGKLLFNQGLASSFRPRKYYTIPRDNLEAMLEDLQELINFFVIEFQRILFVESIKVSIVAFCSCFVSYWLIKWLPFWGLVLTSTIVVYMTPLVYVSNKEVIDMHIHQATDIMANQAHQIKGIAEQHTAKYRSSLKHYTGEYTAKAQNFMNHSRSRHPSHDITGTKVAPAAADFPQAPREEPIQAATPPPEEMSHHINGAEPVAAM